MSEAPNMLPDELERLLRDVRVNERRPSGRRGLFSESVLVVRQRRPFPTIEWIYDRDGELLATFRRGPGNPSVLRRALFNSYVWELADLRDQVLLTVSPHGLSFNTVGVDGSDVGTVKIRKYSGRHTIDVAGEVIGSISRAGGGRWRVLGADDVELGRVSHHRRSVSRHDACNVVEFDDAMPDRLRRLMPAVSKAVFDLQPQSTH